MFIKIGPVANIKEVMVEIKNMTKKSTVVGLKAFAQYIYGDSSRGLRKYPSYRYISRKNAYGQTFVSDKQRRWFWANGGPDMIGDHRTGATRQAWTMNVQDGGYRIVLENRSKGAYYTMHDSGQAAQPGLVGWNKAMDVVKSQIGRAIHKAIQAINASMN
jgi:hypothetical protein